MAKMNALRKKSAIAKYGEAIKADLTTAEAQMTADNYTPEEIAEVVESVSSGNSDKTLTPPSENKDAKPKKAPKTEEKKTGPTGNYEKWKVDVAYEKDEDGEIIKDKKGRSSPIIAKNKFLRYAKISDMQADILNAQSHNTGIKYFPTEAE